jgi:hypothetical protein
MTFVKATECTYKNLQWASFMAPFMALKTAISFLSQLA